MFKQSCKKGLLSHAWSSGYPRGRTSHRSQANGFPRPQRDPMEWVGIDGVVHIGALSKQAICNVLKFSRPQNDQLHNACNHELSECTE